MTTELWLEAWTRPGHPTPGRVLDFIPSRSAWIEGGINQIGAGNLVLPNSFAGFDQLLLTDSANTANSVSSLVRVYSALDPVNPIFEWLPNEILPEGEKGSTTTRVTGVGINGILGYARLEPYDWDGSDNFAPVQPDWEWGASNMVGNPGLENSAVTPLEYKLIITATGGTYTITDGTDTTAAIAWNASAATIETRIQTDLAAFTDILVAQVSGVYLITYVAPPYSPTLSLNIGGLTGGKADITPNTGSTPWTFQLDIDGLGGTYTLSDGTDTTVAIGWDAAASTIKARLEADIAAITTVDVAAAGDGFLITLNDPDTGVTLTVDNSNILNAVLLATQDGGLSPNPWTIARSLNVDISGPMGFYDNFGVSDVQAHTGSFSLLVDPGAIFATQHRNPGAQQVINVTPGVHQASVWVYPTSATDKFRLGIFGVGEEVIALDANGLSGGTLTANTWNQITISDFTIPDGVNQVIFRVQVTNGPSDPSVFYIDDAEFYPGFAPTTLGEILRLIYEHAINPALRTPIVWDDGSATDTPYLTLDFDDVNDSNGVPWADGDIRTRLTMRMSYSQIMAHFATENQYEYRIVPNDPEALTYLWQAYNPGTMDTAPDVAIQGGTADVTRSLRRLKPEGTDQMVEGLDRLTSRARDAGLMAALGRIEASVLSREAPDLVATAAAAASAAAVAAVGIESISYDLVDPQDEPLTAFRPGDTVTVVDPPEIVALASRFVEFGVNITPERVEWTTQFGRATTINPDAAVASAVSGLLTKFEYPFPEAAGTAVTPGEGGGTPTITVAPANSSEWSKGKADFELSGVAADDLFALQTAADEMATTGGRLVVTEGGVDIGDGQLVLPGDVHLMGMNRWDGTTISGTNTAGIISVSDDCTISDLTVRQLGCSANATGIVGPGADNVTIRNVRLTFLAVGIEHGGDNWVIDDVSVNIVPNFIESTAGHNHLRITNCATAGLIDITDVSYVTIVGNQLGSLIELGAGSNILIAANTYWSPGGSGTHLVHANGATGVVYAANNALEADGYDAVLFENCPQPLVVGNLFGDVTEGIRVDGCDGAKITDNIIGATTTTGQYVGGTGIWVQDSDNVTVTGNTIIEPGQDTDDTFYGVALAGACADAHVTNNKVIPSTDVNRTSSGIAVGVGVTCAVVVSNSLGDPADYGTDALEDFGTDTQLFYPSDPTYGDNFTACGGSS